ncbi:uncharacterized protein LOC108732390 isoform X2 [Agrilus planipennis]|uniref:Uncharacterized protein LOC108732390 isoform X2 n=2 Tax=Agrilus planipennis TaxID=224129 RepID=A0A1W4WF80_AGRPL|nr:uncharacterized protein LOC108732390 isoform X2 [Agrilus planipennis]
MHLKIAVILVISFSIIEDRGKTLTQKLTEKAKAYYKTKYGKDSSTHFLGYDITEYPGRNAEYKKIHRKKWEKYYSCLQDQEDSFGNHGSATPEAVLGFQCLSIRFDCKVCISPLELSQKDAVEWYWTPKSTNKLQPVEYTEHVLLSSDDKALTIYNLQDSHTGQYICFLGKTGMSPYFLTVIDGSLNIEQVYPTSSTSNPHPAPPKLITQHNVYIYTEWSQWSPCSRCGKVGKIFKTGYCTVISGDYFDNSEDNTNKIKTLKSDESGSGFELFTIFKLGIPCQSHILPSSIKYLDEVQNRKNEIMIGFCKKSCNDDVVFEVRDGNGRVIETANNSAGIYSIIQGIPPVDPDVKRKLIYAAKGEKIILTCPGNLNSDAPVQWQINSKVLIPEIISEESKNRIVISVMDKIIIKDVHLTDSNIYRYKFKGNK